MGNAECRPQMNVIYSVSGRHRGREGSVAAAWISLVDFARASMALINKPAETTSGPRFMLSIRRNCWPISGALR
jgi:hypothetical protein